jgi:hypothetical protein
MNTTVRTLMRLQSISAYGTSEGVKKEWETRHGGQATHASMRMTLRKHGFNEGGSKGIFSKLGRDRNQSVEVSQTGAWRHTSRGDDRKVVTHGEGDSASSLADHLSKFGEGAKSRPAWGYGGDDDSDRKEETRKFGEGAKSRPPSGYGGEA